jgi:hypothetical protein
LNKTYFQLRLVSPKKISIFIFLFLFLFFIYHTSIWFLFTQQIFDVHKGLHIGDLARLSYQTQSIHIRDKANVNLNFKHIESKDYYKQKVDILTIGDSFSNGGAGGENPYYQDYIASIYHKTVLNISPSENDKNYIETIISLYNNGLLDQIKPHLIVLSSVERSVLQNFSKDLNWDHNITQEQSLKNFKHSIFDLSLEQQQKVSIINNGNYKYFINPILYAFSSTPLACSNVYKVHLEQSLFTVKANKTLLFHKNDLDSIQNTTSKNINKLNENLNKLSELLKKKDISLAFMPAIDKYNLYSSYIYNNPFPKSSFFEQLRPLQKAYYFIDTKSILSPYLPSVKDLYYADDTHWNHTAAKKVTQHTYFDKLIKTDNAKQGK